MFFLSQNKKKLSKDKFRCLVFYLPAQSGEKTALAIAILVSQTLYFTLVIEVRPDLFRSYNWGGGEGGHFSLPDFPIFSLFSLLFLGWGIVLKLPPLVPPSLNTPMNLVSRIMVLFIWIQLLISIGILVRLLILTEPNLNLLYG